MTSSVSRSKINRQSGGFLVEWENMEKKSKYLEVAIEAVKRAEKVVLKYYKTNMKVAVKGDLSPLTKADVEAEEEIITTIKNQFPDHGFLGEESVKNIKKDGYLWIIDPIDGTMNYVRKIPLFATQLALMKDGELILGVSNAPALKELMHAEKGKGAYFNGRRVRASSIKNLNNSYMLFGGVEQFMQRGLLKNLVSLANNTQGHRGIGDFWSYHLLAQGKADIMIEARTAIWDIAALKVIVEEAGGKMTDIKGGQVSLNTNSILATNGKLHQEVLDYLSC